MDRGSNSTFITLILKMEGVDVLRVLDLLALWRSNTNARKFNLLFNDLFNYPFLLFQYIRTKVHQILKIAKEVLLFTYSITFINEDCLSVYKIILKVLASKFKEILNGDFLEPRGFIIGRLIIYLS